MKLKLFLPFLISLIVVHSTICFNPLSWLPFKEDPKVAAAIREIKQKQQVSKKRLKSLQKLFDSCPSCMNEIRESSDHSDQKIQCIRELMSYLEENYNQEDIRENYAIGLTFALMTDMLGAIDYEKLASDKTQRDNFIKLIFQIEVNPILSKNLAQSENFQ